jgi:hypothetical protein
MPESCIALAAPPLQSQGANRTDRKAHSGFAISLVLGSCAFFIENEFHFQYPAVVF